MKTFRIIQISDLHGNRSCIDSVAEDIASADLVALSGDLTHFGGKRRAREIVDAVLALNSRVVAVAGNCDPAAVSEYLEEAGVSVDGTMRTVNGFSVCGLGGSLPVPGLIRSARELTEDQFASRLAALSAACPGPDIMIIHQPPANSKLDRAGPGMHVGSAAVRAFIEHSGAVVCLTGHIHESVGTDEVGKTTVVNPGAARQGRYAVLEITGRAVSIELKRTGA